MKYMHKKYHNLSDRNEFQNIKDFESTINTKLIIKPLKQNKSFELYYVPTAMTISLIEKIYSINNKLDLISNQLPYIAHQSTLIDMLSSEINSTNEIEGVASSKTEIVNSTKNILNNTGNKNKYKSLIMSYLKFIKKEDKNSLNTIITYEGIRNIYDQLLKGEIQRNDILDGKYFRKKDVFIKNFRGESIHQGISGEENIELHLHRLFEFYKNNDIPYLIRIAIYHYYFAYIHPFYDGNGRTLRFITSTALIEELNWISALSLSQGCNYNRTTYLKIFHKTNQISMCGEMNYFIDNFLNIIYSTQKYWLNKLLNKTELFKSGLGQMEKLFINHNLVQLDRELLNIILQNYLFGDGLISVKELSAILNKTPATLRKRVHVLCEKNLIIQMGANPILVKLNGKILEDDI